MTRLLLAQGLYYLLTGLWPLVSPGTFQRVTGPKRDLWLVKTVGLLIAVVGADLLIAGADAGAYRQTLFLALGSAAALAGVDVVYVLTGTIPPVYLLDAAAELAIIAGYFVLARPV